jgi:hypothetical protein
MTPSIATLSTTQERQARRRAGAKMGWYIHALVYICVNAGLVLISIMQGRGWAVYPAMGWGLGLLIHGLVVFSLGTSGGFYSRLLAKERQVLEGQGHN